MFLNVRSVLIVFLLVPAMGSAARAENTTLEEFFIRSDAPDISLYLRNKRPAGAPMGDSAKPVLIVHGATYPAHTAFDLALDGLSWMDYLAARGYDVYAVDIRGYGRSTRPPEMHDAAGANAPIVTTEVALRDVAAAVRFILERRGGERLSLLGWSWGTTLVAGFAAAWPEQVDKLVLYAPVWLIDPPRDVGKLGAYREVSQAAAKARWLRDVPAGVELIPPGWFEAWADATWATDPHAATSNPPMLRAPNGVLQDLRDFWMAGRPTYDPGKITAPTLLVVGEWDVDTPPARARQLFGLLNHAKYKRLIEIGQATHTVIMEKHRLQLFREVQNFLDE
jgi:pimeloyl-ACP methyl ester carboxylesterase